MSIGAPDAATEIHDGGLDAMAEPVADAQAVDAPPDSAPSRESIPPCDEPISAALSLARIQPLPRDVDSYRPPAEADRIALAAALQAAARGDDETTRVASTEAGYEVCFEGEEGTILLFRPALSGRGHATLALRTGRSVRDLVLESPHPLWDRATAAEAVELFRLTDARAVLISGTHRCASARASGCDGTASACGTNEAVRESDMAHAIDSFFHAAHRSLAAAYPRSVFVSLHGFEGPGVSVSNGTTATTTPGASPAARLARALRERLGPDVTTCNDFGDSRVQRVVRVCGTTNVQGRWLNGAAPECTTAALDASERFIHLEQDFEVRRANVDVVAEALLGIVEE